MGLVDYFTLEKSFPFYAAYHREWRNILIHIVGVPSIAATTLYFLHNLKVPGLTSQVLAPVGLNSLSAGDILIAVYAFSFLFMEPVAATLYMPFLYAMRWFGCDYLWNHPKGKELAIGIHVVAWISQFVGHGVFEGRKPALLDSFFQSVHAAVFFVWLEVLFFFGYRPELKAKLEKLSEKHMPKAEKSKK